MKLNNKDKKDANVRRLEIIGEASKNLSNNLREKHKEIEWNKITKLSQIVAIILFVAVFLLGFFIGLKF